MQNFTFKKRIFTTWSFLRSGFKVIFLIPALIRAYFFNGLNKQFAERLLLVVSGVNACVYCSWFHSFVASKRGIDAEQIGELLNQLISGDIPVSEQPALAFAIHFAESNGRPDANEVTELSRQFSTKDVSAIVALCTAIHFGNLCGNTYDAFLFRLKGYPAKNSSVLLELLVFMLSAPFLLPLMRRA